MTRGRGRARPVAAALLLAASAATLAIVGPGVVRRIVHPARYATSGRASLAPEAYLATARRRLGAEARIARLAMPIGDAPAIVSAWPSTEVYLDPPTARVLDVAETGGGGASPPIEGAQQVVSVIVRARPYAGGMLRRIEWPSERSPDWTVRFGDGSEAVKVADDSGTARAAPMRRPGGATALIGGWRDDGASPIAVRAAIVLVALAMAASALVMLARWAPGTGPRVR